MISCMSPRDRFERRITCIKFNQDCSCLAVCTLKGFSIYSCRPFVLLYRENCGAVGMIEMLYNTSLLCIVGYSGGGGDKEKMERERTERTEEKVSIFPSPSSTCFSSSPRVLQLWDSKDRKHIATLAYENEVKNVKVNVKRLIVILSREIRIYDLKTLDLLHVFERDIIDVLNLSLCSVSTCINRGYLVLPGGGKTGGMITLIDTYTLKCNGRILAHQNAIQALAFNATATLLASASSKGTIIRVWNIPEFHRVRCYRRGSMDRCMYSLSFSLDSNFLICTTDSATVHIFKTDLPPNEKSLHTAAEAKHVTAALTEYIWGREAKVQEGENKGNQIEKKIGKNGGSANNRRGKNGETYLEPISFPLYRSHTFTPQNFETSSLSTMGQMAINSMLPYLPDSCRSAFEASRCFAFIYLKIPPLATTIATLHWSRENSKCEILVASQSGCAYAYECNDQTGGECRLRDEHLLYHAIAE